MFDNTNFIEFIGQSLPIVPVLDKLEVTIAELLCQSALKQASPVGGVP